MSTNDRVRGRKLQDIRRRHFADNPLCSGPDSQCEAQGRVTLATELDHIHAIGKGGTDDGPKQGLCASCHAIKTAKDMGYTHRPKTRTGPDGWPVGGS